MSVWDRLKNPEDALTERKPQGAGSDFKVTIVAFANSVPEGREGVMFVGIADDGSILGCPNVDSLAKTMRRIAENECYPPIKITTEGKLIGGRHVLAVIVPLSTLKPHFSGHAYYRRGAESVKADEVAYADFITARSSVRGKLLEYLGKVVKVRGVGKKIGEPRPVAPNHHEGAEYVIQACDTHTVRLLHIGTHEIVVEDSDNFSVSQDALGKLEFVVRDRHRR